MAHPSHIKFAQLTANGSSATIEVASGEYNLHAYGTFGGGTLIIQQSPDEGTTWLTAVNIVDTAMSFTAPGTKFVHLSALQTRITLSGATSPTVDVMLHPVGW